MTANARRLDHSRSHRIVWLLEELGLDYEVKTYKRGADKLAPDELKQVHPLGKSPVLGVQGPSQDKPTIIAESGLIVEWLVDHYGQHLIPAKYSSGKEGVIGEESKEWMSYRHFMHYAEGSLMIIILLTLFIGGMNVLLDVFLRADHATEIKNASVPFFIKPITRTIASRIESAFLTRNIKLHLDFVENELKNTGGEFVCGNQLTGADIMMIFPLEMAAQRAGLTKAKYPTIAAWIERMRSREAYKKSVQRIEKDSGEKYDEVAIN